MLLTALNKVFVASALICAMGATSAATTETHKNPFSLFASQSHALPVAIASSGSFNDVLKFAKYRVAPVIGTDNADNADNTEYSKFSMTLPRVPEPEPETYAMLLLGLGLMGVIARRRTQGDV